VVYFNHYRELCVRPGVKQNRLNLAHRRNASNWETLAQRRKIFHICALFKAYLGERAWTGRGDRLQRPCYLSRVNRDRRVRSRKQRANIGKYSFPSSVLAGVKLLRFRDFTPLVRL
jgi:hypothetical protein